MSSKVDFFQFKQFGAYHGAESLKICTESCILGAYAEANNAENILDIGTGCGVISLMVAQRSQGNIDAVEIDHGAYKQAKLNFASSPWHRRMNALHANIDAFASETHKQYDLILSNPPFFANHFQGNRQVDNRSKHELQLNQEMLSMTIKKLLGRTGKAYVLYPSHESQLFESVMKTNQLYPVERLEIRNFSDKSPFRVITCYAHSQTNTSEQVLTIYSKPGIYTEEFISLMKPYYLIF